MKKWALGLMLVAVLGLPALACGFPLPVTLSEDASTTSTIVCASAEAADTCQVRKDAYELMAQLQSGSVQDMVVDFNYAAEGEEGVMHFTGAYDFVANPGTPGLGIDVAAQIGEGTFTDASGTEDISNAQFIIVDGVGYSIQEGESEWKQEDLTSDSDTVMGLGLILGLGGMEVNLFSEPTAFTVEALPSVSLNGQNMIVQKLTADITSLMMSPEALTGLMQSGSDASGGALSEEELGMSSEDMAAFAPMLAAFMSGSTFTTTLYIGENDGLIHRVEDAYIFIMDLTALDPTAGAVNMSYVLSGNIVNHNGVTAIVAPANAVESGEGGLLGGLGSGGLGESLFGGSGGQ